MPDESSVAAVVTTPNLTYRQSDPPACPGGIRSGLDPNVPVRLMAFRHAGTRPEARQWPETLPQIVAGVRDRLVGLGVTGVTPDDAARSMAS